MSQAMKEEKKQLHSVLLSYNLTSTVDFPSRVQNQSSTAIDNYKFKKYTVSAIYNGLSNHDAQLLTIKDILVNLQTVNHHSCSIRNINKLINLFTY
jgi:hypothetical protein